MIAHSKTQQVRTKADTGKLLQTTLYSTYVHHFFVTTYMFWLRLLQHLNLVLAELPRRMLDCLTCTYLDQLAAFASVEMRQRALRMEFRRSNPLSELSIFHFQRGVDFGLSERLDCTILHRLTLVSCLEMLERTLINFYSEVFRGCMSSVISLLSGMVEPSVPGTVT